MGLSNYLQYILYKKTQLFYSKVWLETKTEDAKSKAIDEFDDFVSDLLFARICVFLNDEAGIKNPFEDPSEDSLEEIEDPEDDPIQQKNKKWQKVEQIVDEMCREKRRWFNQDLFDKPWHSKLANFFAREENGRLTVDELKALIRSMDYGRDCLYDTIKINQVEESEQFFKEVTKRQMSRIKASACQKVFEMVKRDIAEFSEYI